MVYEREKFYITPVFYYLPMIHERIDNTILDLFP